MLPALIAPFPIWCCRGLSNNAAGIGLGGASNPDPYASIKADLAGYWKCNDGAGANFTDSTANANTLTQTNNPGSTTGQINNCRTFSSAASQYGTKASNATLQRNRDWTFSFYAYHTTVPGYQIYISKDDGSTNREFLIALNPSAQVELQCAGSIVCNSGAFTLSASTWYKITVTWNNTTKAGIIYVNGTSRGSGTGASVISATSAAFLVGAYAATPTLFLNGRLDDIAMGNHVWTPAEVTVDNARTTELI